MKTILSFKDFSNINEHLHRFSNNNSNRVENYRFDNVRISSRIEHLCLKLGIDCRILEYDFNTRRFKYNERYYIPNSLTDFINYLKDKTFIFYPEFNLFVDIHEFEDKIPKWILNKEEVKENGMDITKVESYIRKNLI